MHWDGEFATVRPAVWSDYEYCRREDAADRAMDQREEELERRALAAVESMISDAEISPFKEISSHKLDFPNFDLVVQKIEQSPCCYLGGADDHQRSVLGPPLHAYDLGLLRSQSGALDHQQPA